MNQILIEAKRAKRALTPEEAALVNDFRSMVDADLRDLPAHAPLTQPGLSLGRQSASGPFDSFGDLLRSVAQAGMPGGKIDERLYQTRAATGLGETVPSDGGFLVQTDFAQDLIKSVFETGKLSKLCKRIKISSNSNGIKIPAIDESSRATGSRFGAIQSYWIDEAAEKLASKPKFRQMELTLKKLIGLCYASDELLQDSSALAMVIRDAFVSEFGFMIDNAIIRGGAGQPAGILNSGCLVTVDAEGGQKKNTIVAENVIKMWGRLLPGSESSAVWLVNKNCYHQLMTMSLAVGTGGIPIYMPANAIAGMPYNTLFGRPVMAIEQASTLGTVGDIILADFANGYILAEKGGIQMDVSIHVRYIYDESCFRFVTRLDGMPVLSSAITPFTGSDTQSFFVALATRA